MTTPASGEELARLELLVSMLNELDTRAKTLRVYDRYYRGDQPLAFASVKFRQAFGGLLDNFADSWCPLVVDAVEERLNVNGFRFGEDTSADRDAWTLWQTAGLDAGSQLLHTESLVNGVAYGMVWPGASPDVAPSVTVEHPEQVLVRTSSLDRRVRLAAVKRWTGDDGHAWANLYLPTAVYKYRSSSPAVNGTTHDGTGVSGWARRNTPGEEWPLPNPLGVVPVVPFVNRPRLLLPDGESELHNVLSLQDAVNKLTADLLVASEYGAFRQRWATGLDVPTDQDATLPDGTPNPNYGKPVEPFSVAVDRLWWSENPETRFGDFSETNLGGYVSAIELMVQHVASQTRTPPHYFYLGGGQPPSGESIKSAETGLVAKVKRKQRHYGEAWEELMRLVFLAAGDTARAGVVNAETLWGDPESRTEGEHVDAALKRKALGVPARQLFEDVGYSPAQVERFAEMRREEAALLTGLDAELGVPGESAPALEVVDPADLKAKADAMGVLIRAGVDPDDAAARVGLAGLRFTGATPSSLRLPGEE